MHRFVAGLGVVAISVRGFTILYNLDGFLCGAFLFKAVLPPAPALVQWLLSRVRLVPAEEEVGGSGGGTIPFGGSFGGLDEELEEIFCSRWLLLLMGEEEMGSRVPPAAWFVGLCGGRGKVGEVVPVKKCWKSKQTVDDMCTEYRRCTDKKGKQVCVNWQLLNYWGVLFALLCMWSKYLKNVDFRLLRNWLV